MDLRYDDVIDDHPCVVSHIVQRNVFTEFDRKLSRHLSAVRHGGFPGVTVTIRAREKKVGAVWTEGRDQHFLTVPHALRGIGKRALGEKEEASLAFASVESNGVEAIEPDTPSRRIDKDELAAFGQGLEFCRSLGAFEFLEVSGDFDLLTVRPAIAEMAVISIDLFRGAVTIPAVQGGGGGFEGALYELQRTVEKNAAARAYFARARHEMTIAREEAVLALR
ncbi:MAG: hypothetical protein AAGF76_03960, partial [Pseudomonadota bacterium]